MRPEPDLDPSLADRMDALCQKGQFEQAEALYKQVIRQTRQHPDLHFLASQMYENQGRYDEALSTIRTAISAGPMSLLYRYWLICLLHRLGFENEVEQEIKNARQIAPQTLGTDFKSYLKSIPTEEKLPAKASTSLEWLRPHSEQEKMSGSAWWDNARLGFHVNNSTFWWLSFNHEHRSSLLKFVVTPDWTEVEKARKQGKGILFLGAHAGPKLLALDILLDKYPDLYWFGTNPVYAQINQSGNFLNVSEATGKGLLSACHHIQDGGAAYITGDGHFGSNFVSAKIFDRSFQLPAAPPALAYYGQAAVFWSHSLWEGGRFRVFCSKGPEPNDGESYDNWCRRWFDWLPRQMEAMLRLPPQNQLPLDGILGTIQ